MSLPMVASSSSNGRSKNSHLFHSYSDQSDTVKEKHSLSTARKPSPTSNLSRYLIPPSLAEHFVIVALPFIQGRRIHLPIPRFLVGSHHRALSVNGQAWSSAKPGPSKARIWAALALILLAFFVLVTKIRTGRMPRMPLTEPDTNILNPIDVARLWAYEIASGRYPSKRGVPAGIQFRHQDLLDLENPGLPSNLPVPTPHKGSLNSRQSRLPTYQFKPSGSKRHYLDLPQPEVHADDARTRLPYPPRPLPRSAIDLDVVMDRCDFSLNRYVRDCLEMLRIGAGLDVDKRVRRGTAKKWLHIYREEAENDVVHSPTFNDVGYTPTAEMRSYRADDVMAQLGFSEKPGAGLLMQDAEHLLPQEIRPPQPRSRRRTVGAGPFREAHPTHLTADPACDPDYPRIFHIFWAGPFTDKPYLAVLSYLFTQNLGLQHETPQTPHSFAEKIDADDSPRSGMLSQLCRPQLWIWINPGPAASIPDPTARSKMFAQLGANPWSKPFLNKRFEEVIKFKLWNTTEQLDGVPELRDFWRDLPLFNSGGVKYGGGPKEAADDDALVEETAAVELAADDLDEVEPMDKREEIVDEEEHGRFGDVEAGEEAIARDRIAPAPQLATPSLKNSTGKRLAPSPTKNAIAVDEIYERVGSTSSKGYDRLSVVLSDMARFVLCHRYGGIYLDADTILLRDWEELWGWHGAFAYRWSRLEKYNTAVLKLQRNSAIGSFLFKSALANGLDFHPMTISRYTKDANVEGLLLRLPDALFDPAWLNTEYYQRDRPPFPYMKRFEDFFDPPSEANAAPMAVGFEGFFKGAFSYHFHNFWWIPFDPARNWPDLGPRFASGERSARAKILQATQASLMNKTSSGTAMRPVVPIDPSKVDIFNDEYDDDEPDLGWATVLKRTFEAYVRGERPNMYGEWISWS